MKLKDLVNSIAKANEKPFKGVSNQQATAIVKAVLGSIGEKIDATDEGRVALPGLGQFVIKHVGDAASDENQKPRKRITLKRFESKSDPA